VRVFIGLGANLGDPAATLEAAVSSLAALPQTTLSARSKTFVSAPIDAPGPDYLNAVVEIETKLLPAVLLRELQRIEQAHGRERTYRNAPRTLDLDLLLYGDQAIATPDLTVPHPRLHERAFVLLPLLELAPELEIPMRGKLVDLLSAVAGQRITVSA
jgi:2-amino-4-hydroxy-6-hydroxymethyldihydropteridine diphosphokinase